MLRVTKTIEYGLIAMRHINEQNNQLCSSKKIATKYGILCRANKTFYKS